MRAGGRAGAHVPERASDGVGAGRCVSGPPYSHSMVAGGFELTS